MKILQPKNDFCIKELFENETVRTYFVSDILGIPLSEIRSVKLKNPFLRRRFEKQKLGILDILIELNDDIKINIEVQLVKYKHWDKRQLFYLAKMYTANLLSGEKYNKLNRCISISILDFNLTDSPSYHTVYRFRDKNGRDFSDVLELHTIELRKKLVGDSAVNDWIRFLNVKREEDLDQMHTTNAGILEAIKELKHMSLSERMRVRYEYRMKAIRDHNAAMDYAHDHGYEEGRQKGRQDGLQQGIQQGLQQGMNEGKTTSIIKQGLKYGASKEQIIRDLMDELHIDKQTAIQTFSQYQKKQL